MRSGDELLARWWIIAGCSSVLTGPWVTGWSPLASVSGEEEDDESIGREAVSLRGIWYLVFGIRYSVFGIDSHEWTFKLWIRLVQTRS